MKFKSLTGIFFAFFSFFQFISGFGQNDSVNSNRRENDINLFIDCNSCDQSNLREELTFINYVRDIKEADVYLLVTYQSTGSGGSAFSFFFYGEEKFKGMNDTLVYTSPPDATSDLIREGQKQMIKLGLMRYIAKTPLFKDFDILYKKPEKQEMIEDKWKSWVFDISLRTYLYGEESYQSASLNTSLSASKTTMDWKYRFNFSNYFSKDTYVLDDTTYDNFQRSKYFSNSIVKSLGKHWSVGYWLNLSSSIYDNIDFNLSVAPAIEFDIYPYTESTRKQFTLQYRVAYNYADYNDTTIYFKTKENLFFHSFSLSYATKQKWGSIYVDLVGSNYLHDFTKNKLYLYTSLSLRIFKGLSFNVSGQFSLIHDQLSLSKGEVSSEDILLRQKQIATQYNYYGSVGLSYTFGSIYNNVVNPRFDSGNGM
jgi:hypothetical protein